jgi:Protein of unknown function (DUF3575)
MITKKLSLLALFFSASFMLNAQRSDSTKAPGRNNILKINLSALLVKNISVQYERKISKRSSVALNARLLPFGNVPLKSRLEKIIDDPSVDLNNLKLGNIGITPEYRMYVGKKGALHGFYFGPFISFNNYKTDLPITYDDDTRTGIFSGKLKAYTFGLQLGAQWKLGKSVYLDWWILGPNYGTGSGDLVLATSLTSTEQDELKQELEDLKNDAPLDIIKSYEVNANGANIVVKGPWAGLRGMGINLGFRF